MNPDSTKAHSWRDDWIGIVWFVLLFLLALGIANGHTNQNSNLLPGLHMADPNFLAHDWMTSEVTHSHRAFSWLIALAAASGALFAGLTTLALLQNALFALAAYAIAREIFSRPLLPWAAALALFASFNTQCLGSARWLMPYVEPSSLAGVAMTGAVACLLVGRYLPAGVLLGVAALLHEHFVILSMPLLIAGVALIWRRVPPGNRARQWLFLCGAFFALALPNILLIQRFASSPGAKDIRWLTASLFPYHILPRYWSAYFYQLYFSGLLFGLGGFLLRPPRRAFELGVLCGALFLTVSVSVVVTLSPNFELLTHVWPWRLSALLLFLGFVGGLGALAAPEKFPRPPLPRFALALAMLVAGLAVLARISYRPATPTLWILCVLPAAWWLASLRDPTARLRRPLMALIVTTAFVPSIVRAVDYSHFGFEPNDPGRAALYQWIAAETPEDAIFAIPPSWEDFRLNARRPIVADWKTLPRYPPDRILWLERMRDLTQIERLGSDVVPLDRAYAEMDRARAAALQERYGVRYCVHTRDSAFDAGRLVYDDGAYRVWELAAP